MFNLSDIVPIVIYLPKNDDILFCSFIFHPSLTKLIGVFNKNIQEMEASGDLDQEREKWLESSSKVQECSGFYADGDNTQTGLGIGPFIPVKTISFNDNDAAYTPFLIHGYFEPNLHIHQRFLAFTRSIEGQY